MTLVHLFIDTSVFVGTLEVVNQISTNSVKNRFD